MSAVDRLQHALEYRFVDGELLRQALTHRSAGHPHNERLEFLGDAMLGLLVAEELYRRFADADEGQLTRLRASLVRKETLAAIASRLELGACLKLGEGEMKSGGFRRESILANAFEALIGALYLDAGYAVCRERVLAVFGELFAGLSLGEVVKDAKTELQEWLQARSLPLPSYVTVKVEGESHDQRFTVECLVDGLDRPARGEGRSRRQAEQQAAAEALTHLEARR